MYEIQIFSNCKFPVNEKSYLEFPQTVIQKGMCLPKVPICRLFEKFRMAVLRLGALE